VVVVVVLVRLDRTVVPLALAIREERAVLAFPRPLLALL
jgi:hypothetical protein